MSTRPSRRNVTPSSRSIARRSAAKSPPATVPSAMTTRCHGTSFGLHRIAQPTMRAARGLPEDTLRDALECANMAIYHAAARDADKRGMGTTFTAVWMGEGEAYLAHVGDSRAYLLRDGRLLRVSRDHTLVEELVAHGHITREQAKTYPHRNYITRALGVNATVQPDILRLDWLEGDVWLLCSDGLTNEVEEAAIERVLKGAGEYGEKLSRIVRMALEHGGRDNITGILVTTEED